jgi:hypothetical protein
MKTDFIRLRDLAKRVREIAENPLQDEHRKIWTAVNDKKMIKPAVLARDICFDVLEYGDELKCQIEDEELRFYEAHLLAEIYQWNHLRCHSIVEKHILCPAVIHETSGLPGDTMYYVPVFWRLKTKMTADHFGGVIRDEQDFEKIKVPDVEYDRQATQKRVDFLNEVFGGILPVYPSGRDGFRFSPWDHLFKALGLQEGMYNLALQPDFMKALIQRYVDVFIAHVDNLEKLGLLNHNNRPALIGQGGYGCTTLLPPPPEEGVLGAKQNGMWGSAADQIFTAVSPEMTREFAFEPEKRWAQKFGLMYYGCCERLDQKLDDLLTVPQIHKISCSPFSKREAFMEKLADKAVVSFKPDSIRLTTAGDWDKEACRDELIDVCALARKHHCNVEILMKTFTTFGGDPTRLWKWCDMATDIVNNY